MTDPAGIGKWNRASLAYDWMNAAEHRRLAPFKRALFQRAEGRVLLVGAGTGQDFELLPSGCDVIAIDISPAMVELARERAARCRSSISVVAMDVQDLAFTSGAFDTVLAVCVFCSVARPSAGLLEVRRVLRPGGRLLMIEHVRSRLGPIAMMQDLMTVLLRWVGPDMNRDTVQTLVRCGFRLAREENIYLDVIKSVEAQ
ncbi:MAG: class I SAM-dependent methyltransferase [Coriobacteriia bacterium]